MFLVDDTIKKLKCVIGYYTVKFGKKRPRKMTDNFWCHKMRARVEKLDILGWNLSLYIFYSPKIKFQLNREIFTFGSYNFWELMISTRQSYKPRL